MEIETITDIARKSIVKLCNETVIVEYDLIMNYPRIIDHIINFEKIDDKQLVKAIDTLGKESLGHFAKIDRMMGYLGGDMVWQTSTLPRLVGVLDILDKQLTKERIVRDSYVEAKNIVIANRVTIKAGGFFDRLRGITLSEKGVVSVEQLTNDLDRLISDEKRHIKVVEDSIATCKWLKQTG